MMTGDIDRFADIPDPARREPPRPVPPPVVADEPSPTRAQASRRRKVAFVVGAAGAVGMALALGLRADLFSPAVLLQIGVWTVAAPLCLSLALRPRAGGFPASVRAMRLGAAVLAALFVGLACIPISGLELPLTPKTVRNCFSLGTAGAIPALLAAAFALQRTFLNAPVLRGACVGAVCGLAGAIGIHAHCAVVSPSHVVVAHGLPILVLAGAGAAFGARRGRV